MAKYVVTTNIEGRSRETVEADTFDLGNQFITFFNTKQLVPTQPQYDHVSSFRDFVAAFASGNVVSIAKTEDK